MMILTTQTPSTVFTFDNEDQHHDIDVSRDAAGQDAFKLMGRGRLRTKRPTIKQIMAGGAA